MVFMGRMDFFVIKRPVQCAGTCCRASTPAGEASLCLPLLSLDQSCLLPSHCTTGTLPLPPDDFFSLLPTEVLRAPLASAALRGRAKPRRATRCSPGLKLYSN